MAGLGARSRYSKAMLVILYYTDYLFRCHILTTEVCLLFSNYCNSRPISQRLSEALDMTQSVTVFMAAQMTPFAAVLGCWVRTMTTVAP